MRKQIYSTKEPKFFANMCNIVGTEDATGESFEDWLLRVHDIDADDISEEEYDEYFSEYREDADNLETAEQEYSSSDTSINSSKLPAVFKLVSFEPGSINLDYGGGKFDNAADYLREEYDATNLVYDPYNRTDEHNKEVLKQIRKNGGADTATCSNVLNVIKEPEARYAVLRNINRLVKPSGTVYITVYEGTGDAKESATQSGKSYQLNRKTKDYMTEIQDVFPDATRKGKLIIAHPSKVSASKEEEMLQEVEAADDFEDDEVDDLYLGEYEDDFDEDEIDEYETSYQERIEIPIDATIIVATDGSWSYDERDWAINPEEEDGKWYGESTEVLLGDSDSVISDMDVLLQLLIPMNLGTFRITGTANLVYDIEGITAFEDIDEEESYETQEAFATFNMDESEIEDFQMRPI